MSRSLRSDDAELRQVTPQRVDRLCPLAHQKIACTEQHPAGLLPLTLHGHDAYGRSLPCLAYRLRVRRVVLVPFDEGFHIDRRDQFHLVAELLGLPPAGRTPRSGRPLTAGRRAPQTRAPSTPNPDTTKLKTGCQAASAGVLMPRYRHS